MLKYITARVFYIFKTHAFQLLEHLNKVNFTTPHGEEFFFQGADIPAVYDLVNWKSSPDGSLEMFTIGRLVGSDLHLNESAIQWSTGSTQVVRISKICHIHFPLNTINWFI